MPTTPRVTRPDSSIVLISDEAQEPLVPTSEEPAEEKDATAAKRKRHERILEDARERWTLVSEAEAEQRQRELDDLRFNRGGTEDQWPEDIVRERAGGLVAGKMVPAKPCLTVNKLDQPVQQVVAEARNSRLSIICKPKGEFSSPQHAELRTGLIRTIEVDSNAQFARMDALERAVQCGRGYYRIATDYANDLDYDQDILVESILDQACVYRDPMARKPDASDMEWAFVTTDMTPAEYERRFGQKPPKVRDEGDLASVASDSEFASTTDVPPSWLADDVVRVAEYFWVEHVKCDLVADPATGERFWAEPWPVDQGDPPRKWTKLPVWDTALQGPAPASPRRTVDVRKVKWALITWTSVLQEAEWLSQYIPIIEVTGKRYVVEGKRVIKGLTSGSKDAQRGYNYMFSEMMTRIGLGSRAQYILDPRQIEDYEEAWRNANVSNLPYLPYDASVTRPDGSPVPPPGRNFSEPEIQAVTVGMNVADQAIKATTGRFDPSLGNLSGSERSGKAIRELKQQGEQSSSVYLDNLASISMAYEGRILLDLMPAIYDRPGRVLRLLGEDPDDERWALVKTPYTSGPDGRPVPVSQTPPTGAPLRPPMAGMPMGGPRPVGPLGPPQPPPMGGPGVMGGMPMPPQVPPAPQAPPEPPILFDLDEGDYAVQVSVGKSFQTQRDQDLDLLTSMMETTKGAIAPQVVDIWAELFNSPIGRKLSKRFRSVNPNLDKPAGGLPPEVQAQMQQMQQALQQTQQQLQAAQQELQSGAAKSQIDAQVKQLEIESRERLEAMKLQAQIDLEHFKAQQARALQDDQQAHEVAMQTHKHGLARTQALEADERQWDAETARFQRETDVAREDAERDALRGLEQEDRAFQREMATRPVPPGEPPPSGGA